MFAREALLASSWYQERLRTKQERDIALWRRHVHSLETFRLAEQEFPPRDDIDFENRSALARADTGDAVLRRRPLQPRKPAILYTNNRMKSP